MATKIPIIVFNGYFKGTKEKQAELSTYVTFDDPKATWSIIDNKDIDYKFYNHKNPISVKHLDNTLSCKAMIRKIDNNDNAIYITVSCSRTGKNKKNYSYAYSVSLIIAYFDKSITIKNYYTKMKKMCLDNIISTYDTFLVDINKLRDKGFKEIEKEEEKSL